MKLYYAQKSPYVRKAFVVANEAGIEDKLEKVDCSTTTPVNPDPSNANPLVAVRMSVFGTKREFSPERLKGRKPPHCRRSGLNVGSPPHCRRNAKRC